MMSDDSDEQQLCVLEFEQSQYSMRINECNTHITETIGQVTKWCSRNRFTRYIVPQRNDALFRCAAKAFLKTNVSFNLVKNRVVDYLKANREKYEQRITLMFNYDQNVGPTWKLSQSLSQLTPLFQEVAGAPESPWDAYMYKLENTPNGGGIIEAEILSKLYLCDVFIYRDLKNPPLSFLSGLEDVESEERESIHLLSLHGSNHFDLLIKNEDLSLTGACQSYAYESLYSGVFGFPEAVKDAERARDAKRAGMLDHPFNPIHPLDFPRQMIGCLDPRQYRLPVYARLKNGRRLRGFGSTLYDTNETHIEYSEEPYCSQYQQNGVEPVLIFSFQDYWDMLGRDPGQLVRAHSTCHLGSEKNLSEVDSMYAVSEESDDMEEMEKCNSRDGREEDGTRRN